jgi:hypothetical protein
MLLIKHRGLGRTDETDERGSQPASQPTHETRTRMPTPVPDRHTHTTTVDIVTVPQCHTGQYQCRVRDCRRNSVQHEGTESEQRQGTSLCHLPIITVSTRFHPFY